MDETPGRRHQRVRRSRCRQPIVRFTQYRTKVKKGISMHVRVLGPVELITDSGDPLRVATGKRRVILSLLALEANRVVPLDRLVDLLWEGGPPKHARTIVHGHISALRQLFSPDMSIETRPPGYVLAVEADRVDAHRFSQLLQTAAEQDEDAEAIGLLREALALWRGQALPDLAGTSAWHDLTTPWEEARLDAWESLAERLRRIGRPSEAVAGLREALGLHPLREGLAAQLMACLHAAGRQVDALEVYEAVRRRLAEELGLDPGAKLRQTHAAVLRSSTASPGQRDSGANQDPGRRSGHDTGCCCSTAHRMGQRRNCPPAA
ncbi:AfsR/SARP family transcriptional regulator [Streptomyces erythrochromogenes]|uniref:AfsR/SARP family transcriptional regulator n=1 Tax=Streptomyces erythrochromogenes TaxID=285574 RepID=UPI00224D5878|nr:AfsR/SARP family transcriptional regulator [Streptomyces erythrochromogenes]MCX5583179.1 AfsR/SARP family transcriptional regulator [Streptomyces erythrochromogenes]